MSVKRSPTPRGSTKARTVSDDSYAAEVSGFSGGRRPPPADLLPDQAVNPLRIAPSGRVQVENQQVDAAFEQFGRLLHERSHGGPSRLVSGRDHFHHFRPSGKRPGQSSAALCACVRARDRQINNCHKSNTGWHVPELAKGVVARETAPLTNAASVPAQDVPPYRTVLIATTLIDSRILRV